MSIEAVLAALAVAGVGAWVGAYTILARAVRRLGDTVVTYGWRIRSLDQFTKSATRRLYDLEESVWYLPEDEDAIIADARHELAELYRRRTSSKCIGSFRNE